MAPQYVYISDRKIDAILSARSVSTERTSGSIGGDLGPAPVAKLVIRPPSTKKKSAATRVALVEDLEAWLLKSDTALVPIAESVDGQLFRAQTAIRRGRPWDDAPGVWFAFVVDRTAAVLVGSAHHLIEQRPSEGLGLSDLEGQWDTLMDAAPDGSFGREWAIDCLMDFATGVGGGLQYGDKPIPFNELVGGEGPPATQMEILARTHKRVTLPDDRWPEYDYLVLGSPYYVAYLT